MRALLLIALAAVGIAAESPSPLPEAERKAIEALVERTVKLGYPDTRGATLTSGRATVNATVRDDAEPPLPGRMSAMQQTGEKGTTYAYRLDGLHAHLADGSWLIGLRYHLVAKDGIEVTVEGDTVDAAGEFAAARAAHPFDAAKDAAKYIEQFAPERREAAIALSNLTVPVTHHLKLRPDDMPLAIVVLDRAGCAEAPVLAWALAEQRSHQYWLARYWQKEAQPFDPTGAYAWSEAAADEWAKANPHPASEAPADALRRALHREFRAWLMSPTRAAALDADGAAAAATAMVDPGDPQGHAPGIAALREALRIPAEPKPGASLEERLRSWGERPQQPDFRVKGGSGKNGASMTTSFVGITPAYVPERADLDALVTLTDSDKPSRFHDFAGARTVGDNALRAVARLLGRDPRVDLGRDPQHPWTRDERRETAKALQAWWKEHREAELAKPAPGDQAP